MFDDRLAKLYELVKPFVSDDDDDVKQARLRGSAAKLDFIHC